MLVDISYTVNLDEIPRRLSDLFVEDIQGKYLKGIGLQLVEIETMLATNNMSEKLVDKIDFLRRNLALADMRLKNIAVIAQGYKDIQEGKHEQEDPQIFNNLESLEDFGENIQELTKKLQLAKGELENEEG